MRERTWAWLVHLVLPAVLLSSLIPVQSLVQSVSAWTGGGDVGDYDDPVWHQDKTSYPDPLTVQPAINFNGYFLENQGQVTDGIRFYIIGNPSIAFRDDGVMFVLRESRENEVHKGRAPWYEPLFPAEDPIVRSVVYLARFEGANLVIPEGREPLPFMSNFFKGNDPDRWRTDVRSFEEIVYHNLYEGIDLVYRVQRNSVKYEFHVSPGADPGMIRIAYEGVEALQIVGDAMMIHTAIGDVLDSPPFSFQGSEEVQCQYAIRRSSAFGFDCAMWDRSRTLVIDPELENSLVYSTYLAGNRIDHGFSITANASGSAYVAGYTYSPDFPNTTGSFDTTLNGSRDAFVTKFTPDGSALVFSSYIGGSGYDIAYGVTIDSRETVFVVGYTSSNDFPTTFDAFDRSVQSIDAFAVRLNKNGNILIYGTYYGSMYYQAATGVVADSAGCAYITGSGYRGIPVTPGAFSKGGGFMDAFVAKIDPYGQQLLYSAQIGGGGEPGEDFGLSIALDAAGSAYITGRTRASDFPTTPGAFDTTCGSDGRCNDSPMYKPYDAFVTKLTPDGSDLVYSTFLGDSDEDEGLSLTVDLDGYAYVAGTTNSTNFPTLSALDEEMTGSTDAFLVKLEPNGSALVYSTYIGGNEDDFGFAIAVDAMRRPHVAGITNSTDFPTLRGTYEPSYNGGEDVFFMKLTPDGQTLLYSTYFGGYNEERVNGMTVDATGDVYFTGRTNSSDFPTTPGAFDSTPPPGYNAFAVRLSPIAADLTVSQSDIVFIPPGPIPYGTLVDVEVTVHNIGDVRAQDVLVRLFDGRPPASPQIGIDRIIGLISESGGSELTNFSWIALPPGIHEVCALVDPEGEIAETDKENNEACTSVEVLPPPGPDFVVTPADIDLFPPLPYWEGDLIQINATIHNLGGNSSAATMVRFYDGMPPAPQIGADQPLGPLLSMGSQNVSMVWNATIGNHLLCVMADPDDIVLEFDETNNLACLSIFVLTLPDYVPSGMKPNSPITVGFSLQVMLSVNVTNLGGNASGASMLKFFNTSTPNQPFASFQIPPLASSASAGPFIASWTSPAIANRFEVTVLLDSDGNLTESNETNNAYTWTIDVVAGPITSLVIGAPNYTTAVTYVRSSTPLDLSVVDQSGTGINHTWYRIDNNTWTEYLSSFFLTGEGEHYVEWYSEDNAGNVEAVTSTVLVVDDTPPTTTISPDTGDFTTDTVFTLVATDSGCGVKTTKYRIDGGSPIDYTGGFTLSQGQHTISFNSTDRLDNEESENHLDVTINASSGPPTRPDYLPVQPIPSISVRTGTSMTVSLSIKVHNQGNATATATTRLAFYNDTSPSSPFTVLDVSPIAPGDYSSSFTATWISPATPGTYRVTVNVDYLYDVTEWDESNNVYTWTIYVVEGPITSLVIGAPNYTSTVTYVRSTTPFDLSVVDQGGTGIMYTRYRIDNGTWTDHAGQFFLAEEGEHYVEWYSEDNSGNVEEISSIVLTVDNTPPTTTFEPATGDYTTDTMFTLTAADGGSGVNVTRYRIDGGAWTTYSGSFTLTEGTHNVSFYSIDMLDNTEAERWREVTISGEPPPPEVEANYKPVVAVIFAIVLLIVGLWSSRRRPWKGGEDRMAVTKAFTVFSMPFVLAEVATGVVSALTGALSIPPVLGAGTAVDVTILAVGLAVVLLRVKREQSISNDV